MNTVHEVLSRAAGARLCGHPNYKERRDWLPINESDEQKIGQIVDNTDTGVPLVNPENLGIGQPEGVCQQDTVDASVGNNKDCLILVFGQQRLLEANYSPLQIEIGFSSWELAVRRTFRPLPELLRKPPF